MSLFVHYSSASTVNQSQFRANSVLLKYGQDKVADRLAGITSGYVVAINKSCSSIFD